MSMVVRDDRGACELLFNSSAVALTLPKMWQKHDGDRVSVSLVEKL
jgi:hypothetical protein